ncbi:hypothetical protein [Amphritea pacifica]|uniref:hypothetical protein n=1 Tax=Amphritea pacifica TaxID=2811233 RepID=UPI00196347FA|nr:hypothetical protein [Amphritea pacifica]MBN1007167.1 hypothetical protein [Amphritea pacifica]
MIEEQTTHRYNRGATFLCWLGLYLSIALVAGCDVVKVEGRGSQLASLRIVALPDANQQSSTAVDLVFIYSSRAATLLPRDAAEWFAARNGLKSILARQADLVSLEIPPGDFVEAVDLPERYRSAIDVVIYANYLSKKGQQRVSVSGFHNLQLVLKKDHIEYLEVME